MLARRHRLLRRRWSALSAEFSWLIGLAFDHEGNLYVTDHDNHRIRRIDQNGVVSTVAGSGPSNGNGRNSPGNQGGFAGDGGPATSARLDYPNDVAFDADGNMYIADAGNIRIRKVNQQDYHHRRRYGTAGSSGDGDPGHDGGPSTGAL